MLKFTRVLLSLVVATLLLNITGCGDETVAEEAALLVVPIKEIITPDTNKKEIDLLKIKMASLAEKNLQLKAVLEERMFALESKVSLIEETVTKNTGAMETLGLELTSIANKVTNFFKTKKVASRKKHKKKKVAAKPKPKYKIIGIDQWGAYKYVQLMDTQGNLRLLRKFESVDGWTVNVITKKKVTLVNAKGVLMILVPRA